SPWPPVRQELHRLTGKALRRRAFLYVLSLGVLVGVVSAQTGLDPNAVANQPTDATSFGQVETSVQRQLEESLAELSALREAMAQEKVPLGRRLRELEDQLLDVRREYQQTTRLLDSRTLDLTNLRTEIQTRNE